jgi:CheY-like chemotaxis protein
MADTKPTILFVDDEPFVMRYWFKSLEFHGDEVTACPDADDTLNQLQARPFALVILDIMMPPNKSYANADTSDGLRTGLFVYHDIRKLYPYMPIIVLTNVNDEGVLKQLPVEEDINLKVEAKKSTPPIETITLVQRMLVRRGVSA